MNNLIKAGDTYAGHRVLDVLGAGGTSTVYLVLSPEGVQRALKVFMTNAQAAPKLAQRFAREGEILASIYHDNIVRFFGAGSDGERVWLLLELVPGRSLRQRMVDSNGLIPLEDGLRWILSACEGVAAAHAVGVVHRDLKPSNILITDAGGVKVIDFGYARVMHGAFTTHDQRLGAAMYMAPERVHGAQADERSDVFAIGTILYEVLAGRHPIWPAPPTLIGVVQWHLTQQPRPLVELAPNVPPDLADLVRRAMEKDPEKRVKSALALAKELREVLSRLGAPLRRVARNVVPSAVPAFAPTVELPVVDGPNSTPPARRSTDGGPLSAPRTAPRGTMIMETAPPTAAGVPALPADRAAVLPQPAPVAPPTAAAGPSPTSLPSSPRPVPVAPPVAASTEAPPATVSVGLVQPPDRRSTGAPVERSIAPTRAVRSRAWLVIASVVVLAGAAAASWYALWQAPPPSSSSAAARPVPSLSASASAMPHPSASAHRPPANAPPHVSRNRR